MKSSTNGVDSQQIYAFGEFVLDRHDLRRSDDTPIDLTPRLFGTLRFLVEHHQRLLPKEEIMEAVWPDTIVEENNLAQAVSKLRQVLGEKPGAEFIATVPRRGYRFVAPVRSIDAGGAVALRATDSAPVQFPGKQKPRASSGLWIGAAILLVAVIAYFWWQRFDRTLPPEAAALSEKSIAVLPFDNLSSDKADAFFADGIQDDILTSLGKIKDLKVIARASTQDYRGTPSAVKLREIARALGASHLLEGSVRRAADRVVVDVALIDTRDQRQVWAERYDRTLTDTLSLQGELAIEIARELRANLTPSENAAAGVKPTQNAEAYVLYLRGREAEPSALWLPSSPDALEFYRQAVARDPKFALARARLSICASYLFRNGVGAQWEAVARAEGDEAIRLQPQLGEAHLAQALLYLWSDNDDDRAMAELDQTAKLLPNSAEVPLVTAYIYKRRNQLAERVAALARAESLDPRNRLVLSLTYVTHEWMSNWAEAIRTLERRSAAWADKDHPNYLFAWDRAENEYQLSGDVDALDRTLRQEIAPHEPTRPAWLRFGIFQTSMLKRDYAAAAESLASLSQNDFEELNFDTLKSFHLAALMQAQDPTASATREALITARDDCQSRVAKMLQSSRDRPPKPFAWDNDKYDAARFRILLALAYSWFGEKEQAIATAQQAIEQSSMSLNSIEQNHLRAGLALVYAQVGEADKAIDLIEALLKLPADFRDESFLYNITVANLKVGWQWDCLRNNSRFQKLLTQSESPSVP